MRRCVTGSQMQEIESKAINQIGMPTLVLMEKAAMAIVEELVSHINDSTHIWFVSGMGNNGADGIAAARILSQRGYTVTVVTVGNYEKASNEYKVQERIASNVGVPFVEWIDWQINLVKESDWIVDGIFGIGLSREITGDYKKVIEMINPDNIQSDNRYCKNVMSIDIPSGVSSDTGMILGCAVKATCTVTFGYEKAGLYLGLGLEYSGTVKVADIGLPEKCMKDIDGMLKIVEDKDCLKIPQRSPNSNKGSYGKMLIVAGSEGMSGAAYLSAKAAYRAGAGLVKILTVDSNRTILQTQLPEAIIQGYHRDTMLEEARKSCEWATTIIMGPGLGQNEDVSLLIEEVLKQSKDNAIPTVLDSDVLNIIARDTKLEMYYGPHVIITPHMKEMSRLTKVSVKQLKLEAVAQAKAYSEKYNITCIMKDATSIITNDAGEMYLNISGNSALAKGGSGDVLTGIVGGFMAIGMKPIQAAAYGSYMHGRAGTRVSEKLGIHAVLASEIADYLWK